MYWKIDGTFRETVEMLGQGLQSPVAGELRICLRKVGRLAVNGCVPNSVPKGVPVQL